MASHWKWSLLLTSLFASVPAWSADPARPSLVLIVVVDQLPGRTPERFRDRFGEGGFRYFFEHGVVYRNAHFSHGATSTGPGHATLMTGAPPRVHGVVGNRWVDAASGREVYCAADSEYSVLEEQGTHLAGSSPRNLLVESFTDRLVTESDGESRVISVSTKDRSAIFLGGRLGKAHWYSRRTGRFVTSNYYYDSFPGWLREWNARRPADRYRERQWHLLLPPEKYRFIDRDDQPWEQDYRGLGTTFPHDLGAVADADFFTVLRYTPFADELLVDLAGELLTQHELGQRGVTDILAVGLSATDRVGHRFGPDSLEAEDNMLRLDRHLAALLGKVDHAVGLENTLIVLSADHGITSAPEFLNLNGAGVARIDTPRTLRELNSALSAHYGIKGDLVLDFSNRSLYLDLQALAAADLDPTVVERYIADAVSKWDGIRMAVTRSQLLSGELPATPTMVRLREAFHPERSGHVFLVQEPGWYLQPDPWFYAAEHGSLYDNDTSAALMFAAPGMQPASPDRQVLIEDLAPTVSAYLGIEAPQSATGEVLNEVLEKRSPGDRSAARIDE